PLHEMYRQAKHAGHFLIKGNQMLECLADLIWSGVAHRHPTLHFVSVEAGMGWIASHLHIWDRHWKDHHEWIRPKLEELPSSYFHRQFWVSFEQDRAGILTRELLNVDHLMWGSDYPHCEGTFPQSRKMVAEIFAGVPAEETCKMVRDNAAQLYGIT
ncbi:MAG: amidohydrolase family protein, partial [Candidatus Binatia bacterium]